MRGCRTPERVFTDVFGLLGPEGKDHPAVRNYLQKKKGCESLEYLQREIFAAPLQKLQLQACPGRFAEFGGGAVEIAGSPCQAFSAMGSRAGFEGEAAAVVTTWLAGVRAWQPHLVIHENVEDFPVEKHLLPHLREWYEVRTFIVEASDHGVPHHRKRRYTIARHEKKTLAALPMDEWDGVLASGKGEGGSRGRKIFLTERQAKGAGWDQLLTDYVRAMLMHIPYSSTGYCINIVLLIDTRVHLSLPHRENYGSGGDWAVVPATELAVKYAVSVPLGNCGLLSRATSAPALTCTAVMWSERAGRTLCPAELFLLQGHPAGADAADAAGVAEVAGVCGDDIGRMPVPRTGLARLAGNAMAVPAVGTVLLVALVLTQPTGR
eukprot:gene23788-23294_t